MEEELVFLKKFPKDDNELYIVYDLYTFDNLFRLLLAEGFDHEDALSFILASCSLSGRVFQEKIHNLKYEELSADDALSADEAACKAQFIYDMMEIVSK